MGSDKFIKAAKNLLKLQGRKPLLEAVRIDNALTPIRACLEPPRLPTLFLNLIRMRQSPIPKLTDNQRQIGAAILSIIPGPSPVRPAGKVSDPTIPFLLMVWNSPVMMEIIEVTGNMKVVTAGRVIDNKPGRVQGFSFLVKLGQPAAMFW